MFLDDAIEVVLFIADDGPFESRKLDVVGTFELSVPTIQRTTLARPIGSSPATSNL